MITNFFLQKVHNSSGLFIQGVGNSDNDNLRGKVRGRQGFYFDEVGEKVFIARTHLGRVVRLASDK
jgi:hypothetical protein